MAQGRGGRLPISCPLENKVLFLISINAEATLCNILTKETQTVARVISVSGAALVRTVLSEKCCRTRGSTSAAAEEKGKRVTDFLAVSLFGELFHPVAQSCCWMKNKPIF